MKKTSLGNRVPKPELRSLTESDKIVVQSNSLIESRYRLSINEQKIVLYALSALDKDQEDFWTYRISISELGISADNIRKSCKGIMNKLLEIEEPNGWIMVHWFSSIRYIKNTQSIEVSISPELAPYLLQLKSQFTVVDLKRVLRMKSSYSIRLYQLLLQYSTIKKRKLRVDYLREIMKVPKSYPSGMFLDTIKSCVKEINTESDLSIDYQYIKQGRKVVEILFWVDKIDHSLREFIKEKRKKPGVTLMETTDKITGEKIHLAVSEKGLLYNKLDPDWRITKERAQEIWQVLYDLRNKGI